MDYRIEKDTLGEVKIFANKLWGAQTQRSLENFKIGDSASMPIEIIHAYAYIKKAAAVANFEAGELSQNKCSLITRVCDEILSGMHDKQFPLVIWQTGSGTQTNMNVNEVIANRAHQLAGNTLGDGEKTLGANDDVNKSQSSNDTFPTAMHIASYIKLTQHTIPAVKQLMNTLQSKSDEFSKVIKIGRTHLMDATPLTLGQEFSAYVAQLALAIDAIENSYPHLAQLALGGSAVGTGLNTPKGFDTRCAQLISELTGLNFVSAKNKFAALASHDAIVESHAALKQLATALNKIANDIRLLASGPRCGLGEITLPANEPGSSIMPGKVNPTQCEALCMVCAQVMGNDTAISIAATQGHLQLNVFKPILAANILQSSRLLGDACQSFNDHCAIDIRFNAEKIDDYLNNSLMLVTALNTKLGYYKAAEIAQYAYENNCTLQQAGIALEYLTKEEFNEWVNPSKMI